MSTVQRLTIIVVLTFSAVNVIKEIIQMIQQVLIHTSEITQTQNTYTNQYVIFLCYNKEQTKNERKLMIQERVLQVTKIICLVFRI